MQWALHEICISLHEIGISHPITLVFYEVVLTKKKILSNLDEWNILLFSVLLKYVLPAKQGYPCKAVYLFKQTNKQSNVLFKQKMLNCLVVSWSSFSSSHFCEAFHFWLCWFCSCFQSVTGFHTPPLFLSPLLPSALPSPRGMSRNTDSSDHHGFWTRGFCALDRGKVGNGWDQGYVVWWEN